MLQDGTQSKSASTGRPRTADSKTVTFKSTQPPQRKSSFWSCCGSSGDFIDYETEPVRAKASSKSDRRQSLHKQEQTAWQEKAASTSHRYPDRWYLSSRTPPAQLPFRTWADFAQLYQAGKIDVDDPPLPPGGAEIDLLSKSSTAPDPPSAQYYPAPKPLNEKERLRQLYTLDLLGRFGPPPNRDRSSLLRPARSVSEEETAVRISDSELQPSSSEAFGTTTLEGHLLFRKVVAHVRQIFHAPAAMITCIEEDAVLCLCESGVGMHELPREQTFDAHTILGAPHGLVVKDTSRDWRFANSPLLGALNARFYAGVPLYAPQLGDDQDLHVLGTLCILDKTAREHFAADDRKKLQRLADLVRRDILTWHRLRVAAKAALIDEGLQHFQRRLIPPQAPLKQSAESLATSPRYRSSKSFDHESDGDALDLQHDDSPQSRRAKVFAIAMRSVFDTLDLPFVYLIRLLINPSTNAVVSLTLVSSLGLPERPPPFDTTLHLRALTSSDGGLIYTKPDDIDSMDATDNDGTTFASGMLVSVCSLERKGYVLAAFASDGKRVLDDDDLDYLKHVAETLAPFCEQL